MTSNPLLILIINMTVVFFVLFTLELLTRGIHMIDPSRKKKAPAAPLAEEAAKMTEVVGPAAIGQDLEIIAVIAAAIAAMGETTGRISLIRRFDGVSWTKMGRIEAVTTRQKMF